MSASLPNEVCEVICTAHESYVQEVRQNPVTTSNQCAGFDASNRCAGIDAESVMQTVTGKLMELKLGAPEFVFASIAFKTYAIREDVEAIKEAVPDTVLDAKTELVAIPNRYVKISRVEMTPAVPKHRYVEISRVHQQRSVNKPSGSVPSHFWKEFLNTLRRQLGDKFRLCPNDARSIRLSRNDARSIPLKWYLQPQYLQPQFCRVVKMFDKHLFGHNFKQCVKERCVYTQGSGVDNKTCVVLYVDDMIVFGERRKLMVNSVRNEKLRCIMKSIGNEEMHVPSVMNILSTYLSRQTNFA